MSKTPRIVRVDIRDLQPGDIVYGDVEYDEVEVADGVDEYSTHRRVGSGGSYGPPDGEGRVIDRFDERVGRHRGAVVLWFVGDDMAHQYDVVAYSQYQPRRWPWQRRRYIEQWIAPVWAELKGT